MIHYITGDLFAPPVKLDAIGHGVNLQGVMGAGIAVEFRTRYPNMYVEYRRQCLSSELKLGDVMEWHVPSGPLIMNIATQPTLGGATTYGLVKGLYTARQVALKRGIATLGLPRIGAGLGGRDWEYVKGIIDATFTLLRTLTVFVFETYIPSTAPQINQGD